jgi:hypothetical protein
VDEVHGRGSFVDNDNVLVAIPSDGIAGFRSD